MIFSTPRFWYQQDTDGQRMLASVLAPFGRLWALAVRKRFDLHFPAPMEKPLICVGNLTAGGAGKTPVALALGDLLKESGHNPHFLTRGYGGTEEGPLQVAPGRDTAFDVGDEALLLVEKAPAWVSRNRALGAQAAFDSGASLVILDDGFQNPLFHKDFSLIVVDGAVGFGNGHVLPAGPLREDIAAGLARAHAAVIMGTDRARVREKIAKAAPALPVLEAALVPAPENPDLHGKTVFAFAGIGRPEKFRAALRDAGAVVEGWKPFPDHFAYEEKDLAAFVAEAASKGASVVTTAKDHVRLPLALKSGIGVFRVQAAFGDPRALLRLIEDALGKRR